MIDTAPLFTPIHLGRAELPNRFVLPGMQRGWCKGGAPTAQLVDYYRRRIAGGVGLIVSESVAVDHPSSTQTDSFARLNPETVSAWARCIEAVKSEGGHIILQVWHEGGVRTEGGTGPLSHHPTLSPSGFAAAARANGRAATLEEITEIRRAFVRSALLAQQAGANGVEVHAAHGYLLDQFLWPATNRRDDDYGGDDIQNRARLPAEIVAGVREACGDDFLISLRFSQWKEADYKARVVNSPEELKTMLEMLRTAGASMVHASTRRFWEPEWPDSPLSLAGWCKRLSPLPVITVGSVGLNMDLMETFQGKEPEARVRETVRELLTRFASHEFDLVSVGRSQIGDPQWVAKVRRGEFDRIRVFRRADMRIPDSAIADEAASFEAS
jgi:2,4-dienoyl-CoA reductase-like NADH-dependent reductase (Old Yellow Enzyme family)